MAPRMPSWKNGGLGARLARADPPMTCWPVVPPMRNALGPLTTGADPARPGSGRSALLEVLPLEDVPLRVGHRPVELVLDGRAVRAADDVQHAVRDEPGGIGARQPAGSCCPCPRPTTIALGSSGGIVPPWPSDSPSGKVPRSTVAVAPEALEPPNTKRCEPMIAASASARGSGSEGSGLPLAKIAVRSRAWTSRPSSSGHRSRRRRRAAAARRPARSRRRRRAARAGRGPRPAPTRSAHRSSRRASSTTRWTVACPFASRPPST